MPSADHVHRVPVVVAGAGPAGLVTAATLARGGVGSLLVERNPGLSPLPRATAVSTRTMELLRSWGLEAEVRAGQLTLDATDGWVAETLASPSGTAMPLGFPGFEQATAASPTTPAAVPQDRLEPVLLRHLERSGLAEVRFGTELVAFAQDSDGVTVVLREPVTGASRTVRAGHLVGADGAHSPVRSLLGIAMEGPDHLNEQLTVLFEAPLAGVVAGRRHGIYFVKHPEAAGVLVSNGAGDRWLYGRRWSPERERLADYTDERLAGLIRTATGVPDLPVEVVAKGAFSFAPRVADRYRAGRAFPLAVHHLDPEAAATLGIGPTGAALVRPDAQVIACWPALPPRPPSRPAPAGVVRGAGQCWSWARIEAAWPSALTSCQARSTRPCSSTRKVERRTPTEVRP
jgi:2-polyprenyl-6-methoxyphenol hydroxylase-like FAD-dependent oxidoreductase